MAITVTRVRATIAIFGLLTASAVVAGTPDRPPALRYDSTTVITLQGAASGTYRPFRGSDLTAIRIEVSSGLDPVTVVLGPDYWMALQPVQLRKGDAVSVRGSRVVHDGKVLVLAEFILRGTDRLVLRSERGDPRWPLRSGWQDAAR
jgi:hypothetical protein